MKNRHRSGGFTLIEVIVTLSMIGGIMAVIYTILYSTLDAKHRAEVHVARSRIGPLILDQIERDIRQLFVFNVNRGRDLYGEDNRISGQEADKLRIVSYVPSTSAYTDGDKAVFSPVNEIGYELTENPDNRDFMILWRREDFFVDDNPLKGGKGTPLYRRVTGFDIKYFEELGDDAVAEDSWDMEMHDDRFPAAIQITLTIEVETRSGGDVLYAEDLDRRRVTFKRWITFDRDLAKQVAVLPSVPLADPTGENAAAGRGKDKDDDDDDDGPTGDTTGAPGGLGGKGGGPAGSGPGGF